MEYMSGVTAKAYIEENPKANQMVYHSIARAIMMLNRVPVDLGQAPSALDAGFFRHTVFGVNDEAPRTCTAVQQLEDHFNLVCICIVVSSADGELTQLGSF